MKNKNLNNNEHEDQIKNTSENTKLTRKFYWNRNLLREHQKEYNKLNKHALECVKDITEPKDDVAISIQHISKIFRGKLGKPNLVLDDVSFEVKKGEFHGFIGNNGAGKTTTIRLILNYYQKRIGKIYVNGLDSKNIHAKDKIGYIPEVSVFPQNLTIYEFLYSFARMSNLNDKQAKEKVNLLMDKYGFTSSIFKKSAQKLSSGQKKKVLLMQALINDPEILIMDEPAANLDPSARIEFYESIKELHHQGKTILISSHILAELEKYIDSVTVLEGGKVKDSGKVADKLKNKIYNYKVISSDNKKLFELLKQHKFSGLVVKDSLLLKINNAEQKSYLFTIAFLNSIEITAFAENKMSLNQIYFNTTESE
ncbi:ABC-2 type transport system ATP-binding protein [Metamycoplasma subdolum]|uniref:ABC-2 type transport system ATP-binding protein n=1 Tax=Metamycoplasma subdolum TaxID=92407 RepID=A0A3M0A279_9BACT|nr:ABC transporter ATP-binding protein [Metamycoplasma subdolum]RMA77569.1 ABC-2 type transport system ATP-binding protein [Metamycoplasma subdolum]WPB50363.1 ABC transporter ATP-binding protein [Metamycoplasma subdolum]